jgi:hypothetical protein
MTPDEMDEILNRIRVGERVDHYETRRLRKNGATITASLNLLEDATATGSGPRPSSASSNATAAASGPKAPSARAPPSTSPSTPHSQPDSPSSPRFPLPP